MIKIVKSSFALDILVSAIGLDKKTKKKKPLKLCKGCKKNKSPDSFLSGDNLCFACENDYYEAAQLRHEEAEREER